MLSSLPYFPDSLLSRSLTAAPRCQQSRAESLRRSGESSASFPDACGLITAMLSQHLSLSSSPSSRLRSAGPPFQHDGPARRQSRAQGLRRCGEFSPTFLDAFAAHEYDERSRGLRQQSRARGFLSCGVFCPTFWNVYYEKSRGIRQQQSIAQGLGTCREISTTCLDANDERSRGLRQQSRVQGLGRCGEFSATFFNACDERSRGLRQQSRAQGLGRGGEVSATFLDAIVAQEDDERRCDERRRGLSREGGRRRGKRCGAGKEGEALEDLDLDELSDEQLEDLFKTYGENVEGTRELAPESSVSDLDADAESLAFAVALAGAANEVKAGEIQVLCVKPLVYWTRFFVIVTGFSRPQVSAIGKKMRDVAEERFKKTPRGDLKPNAWTLLDFGDVVVHIFYPKERAFYNLEEFYGNATSVDLPFETQSTMN